MMRTIPLPNSGLSVSAICCGTADWRAKSGSVDIDRLYVTYREAGGNCFDTAHCYSFWVDQLGTPERLLGQLAAKLNATPNAIALAYLMNHPFPTVPILGTTNVDHLRDGLTAAEITLTPDRVRWLCDGSETPLGEA